MDLNELLRAHQLEVMKASASGNENHFDVIADYAERIRRLRTVTPSAAIPHDPSAPPTIIYGSYAGCSIEKEDEEAPALPTSPSEQNENPDRGRADP